ncbi:MAG: DNA mismatch repair endonuclease MutL, partial [Taibaiella sp.]|nr:DNA mismatch repair endonuclease MutL [Taibaiella sp.]
MPDVIHLLSDHIANQIAAGEVIQRPASAVKEMLENAVDAGATDIQLIIKDAGKELIQVVDNGCGMSPTDARMSFERHATSKIREINDLFAIRTMGFRGEALASIAAVAQVELKTMKKDAEVGTRIVVESTEVKLQEACATQQGTSLSVKNLFYNVPARRHFLKSNTTELRHIIDEFTRVALAHPGIAFRLFHNGAEQFHLTAGNLKTRVVELLGNSYTKNLVPVEEQTEFLDISGFIGKPEAATRTRGNQFFFINNRFIRSPYLHHAVTNAYEGLIEKDSFPFYVLFLEVDPARVDVNVHPTKQEVKFEDDRMMYAYLNAAVKHALARYNIAPSLDFTLSPEIQQLPSVQLPATEESATRAQSGYLGNTFANKGQAHFVEKNDALKRWKELYEIATSPATERQEEPSHAPSLHGGSAEQKSDGANNILLVQGSLLATTVKSGIMMVHIRRAQERIWYE